VLTTAEAHAQAVEYVRRHFGDDAVAVTVGALEDPPVICFGVRLKSHAADRESLVKYGILGDPSFLIDRRTGESVSIANLVPDQPLARAVASVMRPWYAGERG
jgi:hypothetical protein